VEVKESNTVHFMGVKIFIILIMGLGASYSLQLVGFSTGCAGCVLSLLTMKHTDWRLWYIEKTAMYKAGVAHVGIWKICFPPNLIGADEYSVVCCHDFGFNEKFFPLEMKLGQILMVVASFLAFFGLFFSFLTPWNIFCPGLTEKQVKLLFITGGLFYVFSSICVFVPISWNVHSISANKSIAFPTPFHLPSHPTTQRNGSAIYLGFMSGILLLIGGLCVIAQRCLVRSNRIIAM
uniref:Claudin n=1 Tax=Podarcis muralis TaxID=64176 RepID=A0A670IJC2_PODMU